MSFKKLSRRELLKFSPASLGLFAAGPILFRAITNSASAALKGVKDFCSKPPELAAKQISSEAYKKKASSAVMKYAPQLGEKSPYLADWKAKKKYSVDNKTHRCTYCSFYKIEQEKENWAPCQMFSYQEGEKREIGWVAGCGFCNLYAPNAARIKKMS